MTPKVGSRAGITVTPRWCEFQHLEAWLLPQEVLAPAALALPATCAPLMPGAGLVVLMFAPCFLFHAYFGCSVAALQLATPNRTRATNAPLFLLANSLAGLSAETAIAPLINESLYIGAKDFGPSLAVVAVFSTVAGAFFSL